ncbi:MAG TPA: pyridoxamine 5'-phosphate oxidase family protein [Armatimonadota bacterium]|nr:pyridoxamine 5'-phosphate oxidase family protein [Armatimonadota bacterium]HQK95910.1 pyridoxamine 5'-phosphate oxidase family protein [Armatimonadota bacterium]
MNPAEVRQAIAALLSSQRLGVLATQDGGQPHTGLVAFATVPDLSSLVFATDRDTRKYRNLKADPRASMLVDNRENLPADLRHAVSVTANGTCGELAGADRARELDRLLTRHPSLAAFLGGASTAVFLLEVSAYSFVSHFSAVQGFVPSP